MGMIGRMKRNSESRRSRKWVARNNLDNLLCREYVESLCRTYFSPDSYNFGNYNGQTSLYFAYGLQSYVLFVDEEAVSLVLLEKNTDNSNKDKYHKIKEFNGDSCWFECLLWVRKRI